MKSYITKSSKIKAQSGSGIIQPIRPGPKAVALEDNRPKSVLQKKENNTGLPDQLKTGIENLSGYAMENVRVHYNSDKPAQLNALAFAQGTDIHLASGQEKHLPHEAWHVVQQKQGRVQPTMQLKDLVINDDAGLENEADMMGNKALQSGKNKFATLLTMRLASTKPQITRLQNIAQRMQHLWMLPSGSNTELDGGINEAKAKHDYSIQERAAYPQTLLGKLMKELGILTLKEGMSFKEDMDKKEYDIDDLEIFIKGTRGLIPSNDLGNRDKIFQIMIKWMKKAITGRPKTLDKLEHKKMRFGKEPNHFLRVDSFQKGVLEFTIRTVVKSDKDTTRQEAGKRQGLIYENGRSLFAKAMAYYKRGVKTIKAKWVDTNPKLKGNLDTYNDNRNNGDSVQAAAWKTFTGKLAAEFGFTEIKGPFQLTNGVSFEFSKPQT